MKKHTYLAVAAMAGMMFLGQGAVAQDRAADRTADRSNQQSSTGDSAGAASSQDRASQDSAEKRSPGQSEDASTAGARQGQGRSGHSQGQQSKDQKFVEFASTNNQFEIQAAKLAEQQASDDQIKQMAKMIQQDHQQSSQKLQQAAQQAGVQVSQQLKPHQQAMLQELRQLQGDDFDKAWLYGQVAGHTKAVLKFRDASRDLRNPQLKQFASQTLPKLQQHLQQAQKMAQYDEASAQTAGARERASGSDRSTPAAGDRTRSTSGTGAGTGSGAGSSDVGSRTRSDTGTGTGPGTSSGTGTSSGSGTGASSSSTSGNRSPGR